MVAIMSMEAAKEMVCNANRRQVDHGPLFWTRDGEILTSSMLVHLVGLLKSDLAAVGIDPTHYSGHSSQIGAATTQQQPMQFHSPGTGKMGQ